MIISVYPKELYNNPLKNLDILPLLYYRTPTLWVELSEQRRNLQEMPIRDIW